VKFYPQKERIFMSKINSSTRPASIHEETQEYFKVSKKRDRAAAYPRVSDEGLEDSKTLESQEKEIRRYIALKGYSLDEEHVYPEAKTAYYKPYRERPQFMKLLEACRRKQVDVVVVTEFSRISRKQQELQLLMGLIESFGVRIESCTEEYEKSAIGQFLLSAQAFASELEVEKFKWRSKRGKMDRLHDGNLGGNGDPTYGYIYVDTEDETSARYIINDVVFCTGKDGKQYSEYTVVLLIFAKAASGDSVRRIAIHLTQLGIPTRRGKSVWSNNQVHRILTNQAYIGRAIALKWQRDEDHKVIPRPCEEHLHLPDGLIPPILVDAEGKPDVAFFEEIQCKLKNNKVASIRSNKHTDELGLLRAGYAFCGVCGYKMKVKYPSKAYGRAHVPHPPEYYCRVHNGGEGIKNNHSTNIALAALDKAAFEFAIPYILDIQLVQNRVQELRSQAEFHSNTEHIEAELKTIKKKVANLIKLAGDSEDDDIIGDLQAQLKDLEKQKHRFEKLLFEEQEEEEVNAKVQAAITEFEQWTHKVIPRLTDPTVELSYQEKRAIIVAVGVIATVWPTGYEQRSEMKIAPPKIMEILDLVSLIS
jgi:site-specific DNA recombinase